MVLTSEPSLIIDPLSDEAPMAIDVDVVVA